MKLISKFNKGFRFSLCAIDQIFDAIQIKHGYIKAVNFTLDQ